ncbi:dTDP-4-dehydrorhamnose reductase [Bordetella genomosp. 4]|uniref:dTDP-4-dehydrorhamnose reductase n=1 Tax=Bordetella genomosp. 4 TaxID=463044 RepID=A0A261U462_9BORD|nr:dTDP-4-dehydrorhamnose reductase [Bordetella genomosp. 4]
MDCAALRPGGSKRLKILIIGKNGQVGHALQGSLAPLGELVAVDRQDCDLAKPATIQATLEAHRPDIIVNAAAYTAVDRAEAEPELAMQINGTGPELLAKAASASGALLVHYSTDYVFNGHKPAAYVESDEVAPQSSYGRSKLAGEQGIVRHLPQHLILRTSWVHSEHGGNFIKTILRIAQNQEQLNIVADQVGAPTSAALIADITAQLIARYQQSIKTNTAGEFPYGCYHLTAAGHTSWYEYARLLVRLAREAGMALQASPDTIQPIPASSYTSPAPRPANCCLDTSKLRQTFDVSLPNWEDGVQQTIAQLARR